MIDEANAVRNRRTYECFPQLRCLLLAPMLHAARALAGNNKMTTHTLDVSHDEMLIMTLLLTTFIASETQALRFAIDELTSEEVSQIRQRIEVASRLRGKLPMLITTDGI